MRGMDGNWFTRSRSAATPTVVTGRVSSGLAMTKFKHPLVWVADNWMDCTDRMPESPVCSGRNGPTLPAPVPEYGTEPTMADAVDVGNTGVVGVNRPDVDAVLV